MGHFPFDQTTMNPQTYSRNFQQACDALDQKTKPVGSMGTLEQVAAQLSALQGSLTPDASKARTVLFAGDHGVVAIRLLPLQ